MSDGDTLRLYAMVRLSSSSCSHHSPSCEFLHGLLASIYEGIAAFLALFFPQSLQKSEPPEPAFDAVAAEEEKKEAKRPGEFVFVRDRHTPEGMVGQPLLPPMHQMQQLQSEVRLPPLRSIRFHLPSHPIVPIDSTLNLTPGLYMPSFYPLIAFSINFNSHLIDVFLEHFFLMTDLPRIFDSDSLWTLPD